MKSAAQLMLVIACGGLAGWAQVKSPVGARVFSFFGALETVTHDAIGIRRSDGSIYEALLPGQGPLSPQALVTAYRVGDEVEVEAAAIAPRFVDADQSYFQLELRQLKLLQHAAGGELRAALGSPAWRAGGNRLRLPAGAAAALPTTPRPPPDDPFLAATRRAVLAYVADLPNFLVTESITRTTPVSVGGGRLTLDAVVEQTEHIQTQLAVVNSHEQRQDIRVNGKAWNQPFAALPGLHWTGDFAERLIPIFNPPCNAVLQPAGRGQRDGQTVVIYTFRLAPSLCAGHIQAGAAWAYPGFAGTVYISPASHLVVRLEEHTTQLPAGFAENASRDETDWARVAVAGARWLMPVRAQAVWHYRGGVITIAVAYTNYRQFKATSHVTVVGPAKK